MAPIPDPSDLGLADLFARGGTASGHLAAWITLALFAAALLAIFDERRDAARVRGRRRG